MGYEVLLEEIERHALDRVDGDVLEINDERGAIVDHIRADYVYVDGLGIGDVDQVVLRDRQHLAGGPGCKVTGPARSVGDGPGG